MSIYCHKGFFVMSARTISVTLCLLVPLCTVAQERIDLESTFVGDKEQPSVSYITPWKPPEGPSKLYRPIKSISGNALEPIDREVLARSNQFYNELSLEGNAGENDMTGN
jgi:hypothetical protein